MAETKTFRTDVMLTLATGIGMGEMSSHDVFRLMGWLSGGELYSHQMRLVLDEASAAAITALGEHWEPYDPTEDPRAYAGRMIAKIGETMEISPAAKPFHRQDAIMADAIEMVGGDPAKVIVLKGGDV